MAMYNLGKNSNLVLATKKTVIPKHVVIQSLDFDLKAWFINE